MSEKRLKKPVPKTVKEEQVEETVSEEKIEQIEKQHEDLLDQKPEGSEKTFREKLKEGVQEPDGKPPKGLWVTDIPKIDISVWVYKNLRTNELFLVLVSQMLDSRKRELETQGVYLEEMEIKAVFSHPNRLQLDRYRERASMFHEQSMQMMINPIGVRRQLLRHHLLTLDIPDPETGKPLELERDGYGALLDESEDKLDLIHSGVMDTILNRLEIELGI